MALIKGGNYPKCPRNGCFANKDNHCNCLTKTYSETNFECPFFKWTAQMIEERKKYPWCDYSASSLYNGRVQNIDE